MTVTPQMEGPLADLRAPAGGWRTAVVRDVQHPSARSVVLRLAVPERVDHLPGQHYVVRLRADDGYIAQRSYSLTSPASDPEIELFVARLDEGEVSPFLADVVESGDELEVRGPIGGWFVWDGRMPALAIGGGSGVAPLVSMLRYARMSGQEDRLSLAVSARTPQELPYADEILAFGATAAFSRFAPPGGRAAGRLTADDLEPLLQPGQMQYVCGSAEFAEAASQLLVGLGAPAEMIRIERFGPSG